MPRAASPHGGPGGARRIARNAALQMTGDAVSKVATVAFYVVMARTLGQGGFGDFTFALALAVLCIGLVDLGTDPIVARTIARRAEALHDVYWNAVAIKLGLGAVAVAAAMAAVAIGDYDATVRITVALLAAAALAEAVAQTPYAVFEGAADLKPVAIGLAAQRLATAGVGIAAMALGADVAVVAAVYLAAAVATLVYMHVSVERKLERPRRSVGATQIRRLVLTSLPVAVSLAFGAVLARAPVTLLSGYEGNDAVGLFGVGLRLFEGSVFVAWAFVAALVPTLSRATRHSSPSSARVFEVGLKALTLAVLPLALLLALFARPIVTTMFGDSFAAATESTRWLAASVWLYALGMLASSTLIAQDRTRTAAVLAGLAAVVNVGLCVALIPAHSHVGAAAATTLAWGLYAAMTIGVVWSFAGRISPWRVMLGATAGGAGMALVAIVLGSTLVAAAVAAVAYVAVAAVVERRRFPDDFELLRRAVLARGRFGVA